MWACRLHEAFTQLRQIQLSLSVPVYLAGSQTEGGRMGIAAKLVTGDAEELLRAPRLAVEAGGTVRGTEAHTFDIFVKDLSRTGCLVETRAALQIGSIVQLRISGLPQTAARIVRRAEGGYGCEFLRELAPEDLRLSAGQQSVDRLARGRSYVPALIVMVAAGMALAAAWPW
jgi:hypothetical protein